MDEELQVKQYIDIHYNRGLTDGRRQVVEEAEVGINKLDSTDCDGSGFSFVDKDAVLSILATLKPKE